MAFIVYGFFTVVVIATGSRVSAAVFVPFKAAETTVEVEEVTVRVVTGKLADNAPTGIVMVFGTVTLVTLGIRAMLMPPIGAGLLSVTVPVVDAPPVIVPGAITTLARMGAWMVNCALRVWLPAVAVIVTAVLTATELVLIGKIMLICPAGTDAVAGKDAAALLLLVRAMTIPPVGAG